MSALPPDQVRSMRESADAAKEPLGSLARRWHGLHEQAAGLAALAGLAPEAESGAVAGFSARLGEASEWQRELAWQGIEDIDAMMRPGLAALETLTARGQEAAAPALALWREFHAARDAVLAAVSRD
ncbi:hypothetical protein [Erythrobacter sp.]|uniref:hypothetical protein n=1 Tax=Erythrobacter sp. TaxID=1042 RepID=UPI001425D041|nr:hypothetical protein [Erythrobacter sp.]QIQ87406.1 MAG: hypothetical protein G9473_12455 [Erythrobacter sp.]